MFAAIFALEGGCPPNQIADCDALIKALSPFAKPDEAGCLSNGAALFAQVIFHNTPSSKYQRAPQTCQETGRIIVGWTRLDNRKQLCGQLGLSDQVDLSDPAIILAAHRKWGKGCADRLEGDFSFVIFDPEQGAIFCARDALGVKPFYYCLTSSHLIVAGSVAAILTIKDLNLTPDTDWMALFASGFGFADQQTAYVGVQKLRPGHILEVAPNRRGTPERYHTFDLEAPHATTRDPFFVAQYRDAFAKAVASRAQSLFPMAAENSGGLDSASIIAQLAEVLPDKAHGLHTISLVHHQREVELLDELAEMLQLTHETREVRPETLPSDEAVRRAIVAIGHPPEHAQPLLNLGFFEHAQSIGIRTIHSGLGGDEIVTGYAKNLIDELHSRREWRAVFGEIEGSPLRRAVRFAKRLQAGPDDPLKPLQAQLSAKLAASCLSHEYLEDTGLRKRIEQWMLPDFGRITVNSLAALAPGFRYGRTGRLEASALFAATYGMEYRFPLYDRRLIQTFLSTPSIEKRNGSMGRYLHRRAVAGLVPDNIAWQPTKSMGEPLGGNFHFAEQSRFAFDELPSSLQTILDAHAIEKAQDLIADHTRAMEHEAMRARYVLWHVRVLSSWLRNL